MATTTRKKAAGNNRIKGTVTEVVLGIQPLNIGNATFHLRGTSPLVTHNFDAKSRAEMLETQFLQAFYWIGDSAPPEPEEIVDDIPQYDEKKVAACIKKAKFGIPIAGFKNAMVSACRNTALTMKEMMQQIFVSGAEYPEWALIKGAPAMDSRICRLPNKTPVERFRPMWMAWETDIRVEWDKNKMTGDQVANLLAIAGYYVGVCEGRPEKSALGWGRWELA